jgi:hypothetical protein
VVKVLVRKVGTSDCIAERLVESSRLSRARYHSVVTSADDADLLIFAGSDCGDLSDIRQTLCFERILRDRLSFMKVTGAFR